MFKKTALDNLSIIIFIEFILNTYTFSLISELILIPILAFLSTLNVFAGLKKEYKSVEKLTSGTLIIIGLIIFIVATIKAFNDFETLGSIQSLKSISLPLVLSLLCFPFLYLFVLYINYDQLFMRLEMGSEKSAELKNSAKKIIIKHCLLSLKKQ